MRQRHVEATAHLVVPGRNSPHRIVEIEFSPLGARKLTRPGENERQEVQRSFGFGLAGKAIDGTKESAERNRVEDGRSVFDFGGSRAPRNAMVGSFAARAVAMANRKTWPMVARSLRADSSLPRLSTVRSTERISAALISAMGRFPRSADAISNSQIVFSRVLSAFPSAFFRQPARQQPP